LDSTPKPELHSSRKPPFHDHVSEMTNYVGTGSRIISDTHTSL
jgi:hypothetical protein